MARYDVSLADERGAVRSGMQRDRGFLPARGYERSVPPGQVHSWRAPEEMRGHRGGSAGTYGFGEDYEVVRGGPERGAREGASGRRGWSEHGMRGARFTSDPGFRRRGGWGRAAGEPARERGGGYDAGDATDYSSRGGAPREFRGASRPERGWGREAGYQDRGMEYRVLRGGQEGGVFGGRAISTDPYDIAYRNFRYGG
jgi:hypothetical protein